MKLLTKELFVKIPPINSQAEVTDPIVQCKFFMPDGTWTWYVIEAATREREGCGWGHNCNHRPLSEYDPARHDALFFGYVVGDYPELGYFTLSELTVLRGPLGLRVERDLSFWPCRLSDVKRRVKAA